MNPAQLLSHFDRIGEAPDAIPRLRRFILDLAVRGKLVEQDPRDESAKEMLERTMRQRQKKACEEGGKARQPLLPISLSEVPYELPPGWAWERLGNVGDTNIGLTYSPQDISQTGVPVLRSNNIQNGKIDLSDLVRVVVEPKKSVLVELGDLLICARNGSRALVGKAALIEHLAEKTAFGAFMAIFRSDLNQYLFQFICSPVFRQVISEVNTTTINQITQNNLRTTVAPIPPLAEQHRIVAKVDELMALCDRLEATQTERESRRDRLVASSLHHLNNGADADAFREHARFYFNHLPRLTTRPDHIKQLRQTILNLAFRGKLVPQDPTDEPASELLKRIGGEKVENEPFSVPNSWVWVSVDQIGDSRLGKMLDKGKNKGTPRRYLRNINVRWFDFDLSDVFLMRFEDAELDEFALRKGDVLICEGGEPGRASVWDGRENNLYFQKAIHRVRFPEGAAPRFFVNALRQSADSGRLSSYFTGVGIKHFTGRGLSSFVFPLPPLPEQHRIVAKVDELMSLCDQLETQLTTTQSESRLLLEAILHEALTPQAKEFNKST